MRFLGIYLFLFLGCFICYELQIMLGLSAVLSSAITGFCGSFFRSVFKIEKEIIRGCIYTGSFIGMSSGLNISLILIASLVSSVVFFGVEKRFLGLGGKLGSIAFAGSASIFLLKGVL